MKKLISACMLALSAFSVNAQLVSSLNFSTGHDNISGTAMAAGSVDPNWHVTAVTAPFFPTGPMPYGSHVQNPWFLGAGSPVTPANTMWVSSDPTAMSTGPYDMTGGTMNLRYNFETCEDGKINFNATIRSDNEITALWVDGVLTSFTQPASSSNWTTGSPFTYGTFMLAGLHNIEIRVRNYPSGQNNNPAGLNVDGFITAASAIIIDRDNFPRYVCCNAHFKYCMSSRDPLTIDLSADDPSQPGMYEWYVNGALVGSGTPFTYTFPADGSYEVCMRYFDPKTGRDCRECKKICVSGKRADDGSDPAPGSASKNSNPSGVNIINKEFELSKVYPNPASTEINIELYKDAAGMVTVELYDMVGKLVAQQEIYQQTSQEKLSLPVSKMAPGTYLLQVSDGRNVVKQKVVIE